ADLAVLARYDLPHDRLASDWRRGCLLPALTQRRPICEEATAVLWPRFRQRPWVHRCDASAWLPQPAEKFTDQARRQARERARAGAWGGWGRRRGRVGRGGWGGAAGGRWVAGCRGEVMPGGRVLLPEGGGLQRWSPPATWAAIERFVGEVATTGGVPVIYAR